MKLVLDLPDAWPRQTLPDGRTVIQLPQDAVSADTLNLVIYPLVPLPEALEEWWGQLMRRDLPAAAKLTIERSVEVRSAVGWPVRVLDGQAQASEAGQGAESRLGVVYHMLEYGGFALITSSSAEVLASRRDQLLHVLLSGRPDWSGEPVCLAELFA